jgi:hypothetical protein
MKIRYYHLWAARNLFAIVAVKNEKKNYRIEDGNGKVALYQISAGASLFFGESLNSGVC